MQKYISLAQAAKAASLSRQRLSILCSTGRIEGAYKIGHSWAIPNPFRISPDPRKGRARSINIAIKLYPAKPLG